MQRLRLVPDCSNTVCRCVQYSVTPRACPCAIADQYISHSVSSCFYWKEQVSGSMPADPRYALSSHSMFCIPSMHTQFRNMDAPHGM